MVDNSTAAAGPTVATDDIGGVHWQRMKLAWGVDGAAVDASATNPLPVIINDATASGSITAAAQAVALTLNGDSAASVQVTGTWVGTLQFEGTLDGATWVAINAVAASTSGPQPTTTVNGLYRLTPAGLQQMRVTATAWTSGTATITVRASEGVGGIFANQNLPVSIVEQRASTTAATTTAASGSAITLTLAAAGAGLFHYLTSIELTLYSAAARTGAATPWLVTSTNITGSPVWTFSTAGAIGTTDRQVTAPATPLKTAAANTATTIVAPAATGGIWRLTAAYFVAV